MKSWERYFFEEMINPKIPKKWKRLLNGNIYKL